MSYDLLCRRHWTDGARLARGDQLELIDADQLRPQAGPDRTGLVEVDADAVPAPLHATESLGARR